MWSGVMEDTTRRNVVTRKPKRKNKCGGSENSNSELSLPIISNEKLYYDDDHVVKDLQDNELDAQKASGLSIVTAKIKCEALQYERILSFGIGSDVEDNVKKFKKVPQKITSSIKIKTEGNNKSLNEINNRERKRKSGAQKKPLNTSDKSACVKNSKDLCKKKPLKKCNKKSIVKNSLLTDENQTFFCKQNHSTQHTKNNEQNSQAIISQNDDQSSTNMNTEAQKIEGNSLLGMPDSELGFIKLNNIYFEQVFSSTDISDEKLEMVSGESESEKNKNVEEVTGENILQESHECDSLRDENLCDLDSVKDMSDFGKVSLQNVVETFMKNPQVKYLKGNPSLKTGLCFSWLSNNYKCSNQCCLYNHNALNLFTNKLKKYPSKFIMTVVVSMRHDLLFLDVAMAALKVVSRRQIPVVWVTFLTFLVFYVIEPSDSRFLKFWATVARFFCELQKNYSATCGFASLLSIFSQIQSSEQWKIIEFIKLIKQPPVQVTVNFTLLQPVLKLNLPVEFLKEAVESCVATKKDVLKVYCLIVPKIAVMTSPIEIVELLLKLCKALEAANSKKFADDLKQRLREKVLSIQSKISDQKYPLSAFFQEEITAYSNKENDPEPFVSLHKEKSEMDLMFLSGESNYFQTEEDFCNLVAQAVEFSNHANPKPFRNANDPDERQLNRIRQFFRDCQFDVLGKYLNQLKPNLTERAAEEFLKLLFQMKISLQQGIDLLKIILLPCRSEVASEVIASISITLILNLVRINEWEKAYTIVSSCQEKQINLVKGKVFHTNELNTVTQCRIVLLLIEIHSYKRNYESAIDLVKKNSLFSANNSLWELTWNTQDETIRVRILEDLLLKIISERLTQAAYDLFGTIWREQKELLGQVDLRKFVNEILILLLNEGSEEAMNFYEHIKTTGLLIETTVRAVVVTLVRRNCLTAAKWLVLSPNQKAYFTPKIAYNSSTLTVFSFWLEEEIHVMFDAFFDLIVNKSNFNPKDYFNAKIQIQESKPTSGALRPLCLGFITSSLKDACERIQRVLQHQFNPPLKLIIKPYYLRLDEFSLKFHLQKRMANRVRQK